MGKLATLKPMVPASCMQTARIPPKVADPFYLSKEWRKLSASVMQEHGKRCEQCGDQSGRMFVDHIIELKDGGAALSRTNLQVLCASCHSKKTFMVRKARMQERY